MPCHRIFLYGSMHSVGQDIYVSVCGQQEARWHVQSSATGDIQELEKCGTKTPYLFYETCMNPPLPLPPSSNLLVDGPSAFEFVPNRANIMNGLEMTRNRSEFVEYIENVVTNVFHFDKRQTTDMFTSIVGRIHYPEVIFRFVSKDELQNVAPLVVHPPPGLTIRVFLLYGCAKTLTDRERKADLPTLAKTSDSTNALIASLRATDWAKIVVGADAATIDSDFRDPAVFKLVEYACYEVE